MNIILSTSINFIAMFQKPEVLWFFIGLVFLLFELFTPGFFFFFFGLGAWITAVVCLLGEPNLNVQIVLFVVTSVLSLIGLRKIIKRKLFYNNNDVSDHVEDEFTGKEAVAITDFGAEKTGKVDFKGTTWTSESAAEIKQGQKVIILSKDNFKLIVKPKTN
jgi:membrane protein implicated in regulation of membrane protease activity